MKASINVSGREEKQSDPCQLFPILHALSVGSCSNNQLARYWRHLHHLARPDGDSWETNIR